MKIKTISFIAFACLLLFSQNAAACDCAVFEPPEEFERSSAVFIGKVIETGGWINSYAIVKVEKSWKSVETDEVTIYTGYGCDPLELKENEVYLIYTFDDKYYYKTGGCSRTAQIADRAKDLEYLANKDTLPIKTEYLTHNVKIGVVTGILVLIFLSLGFGISRWRFSK